MPRSSRIPQFLIALGLTLAALALAAPDGARAAPGSRSPDGLWTEVDAASGNAPASRFSMLSNYRVVQVDKALLESLLDRAPDIQTPGALTITLPVGG